MQGFFQVFLITLIGLFQSPKDLVITEIDSSQSLFHYQDSLSRLGYKIYNEAGESERLSANFEFVRTLVQSLKTKNSFDFPFDSLKMISILKSPDEKFRVFSWHVPLSDGSFLYYGSIQFKTSDGELKLVPLLDKTFEIPDPERTITSNQDWYGAQYYEIIPYNSQYILLGWKGHTPEIAQKVIEILKFDDQQQVILGDNIWEGKELSDNTRMIFSYSNMVSMHLSYRTESHKIVFDNLAPSDPQHDGDFKFYGPDFTFNSLKLVDGKLRLIENINFEDP